MSSSPSTSTPGRGSGGGGGGGETPAATGARLVFGLGARTNRHKHDEYAEQRRRQQQQLTSDRQLGDPESAAAPQDEPRHGSRPDSTASKNTERDGNSQLTDSTRANRLGAPQITGQQPPTSGAPGRQLSSAKSEAQGSSVARSPGEVRVVGTRPKCSTGTQQQQLVAGADLNTAQPIAESKTRTQGSLATATPSQPAKTTGSQVRARSKSPLGGGHKMVRRKSIELPSNANNDNDNDNINSTRAGLQQSGSSDANSRQGQPAPRMQFNVMPPPQVSMGTSSKASVVSYAKSRIYDRPTVVGAGSQANASSRPPLGASATTSGALGLDGALLPVSIVSGFKPPKQVNVSKAREQWEGGEPFARCKSRQRLAAKLAATSNTQRLLHGTWSMTSVVATQQMQLQAALAQSASGSLRGKDPSQSDPSVKILSRGSVLERVQQFERAPDAADPARRVNSSMSTTRSSSQSSLVSTSSDDEDHQSVHANEPDSEAEISIGGPAPGAAELDTRPLSPGGTSKRAQYKSRVSSLQHQQQQKQAEIVQLLPGQRLELSVGGANQNQQARRASLRRKSSVGQPSCLIPRFYNPPNGKPNTYEIELQKRNISACFDNLPDRKAQLAGSMSRRHFHSIALACGFSEYFKVPLQLYVIYKLDELIQSGRPDELSARRKSSVDAGQVNGRRQWRKTSTVSMAMNGSASDEVSSGSKMLVRSSSIQQGPVTTADSVTVLNNSNNHSRTTSLARAASIDNPTTAVASRRYTSRSNSRELINLELLDRSQVTCEQFLYIWRQLLTNCAYDNAAKFIHLLTKGQRDHLLPDDFVPLIQSIIDDHPGLKFLRTAPDFHMRYIQTVIARIYFCINRSWTGKISLGELRRSNLLAVLQVLSQEEEDINQITDYFSYEHFYVIYCKFWNLDQDHDLLISREDLARHNDASISSRIIDRIFSTGLVSKQIKQTGKMAYSDFVWFLIAEEDKKHPRSIEYWFKLMDLDGDGYISLFEMEYFYYEQMKRLEMMNIEPLPFLDSVCQILDLVNPRERNKISLSDLKRTKMATIFFDTFINLEKYLEHESREFVSTRDVVQDGVIISDWDRYASEEYENLVTEESSV